MAMAKNLSGQGHWSADAKSFSSSSSSHLWLVILSTAFLLFGTNQLIPFAINLIAGTFLIYLLWRFFRSYSLSPVYVLVIMTAIILCTPLTSVILTGQEHTIQIILTISFVYYAASILAGENLSRQKIPILCILALLLTATRYEGLFPVLIVSIMFIFKKEYRRGARLRIDLTFQGMVLLPELNNPKGTNSRFFIPLWNCEISWTFIH